MARQLLRPTFLHTSLRSGLFLSGQRRVGKTIFFATDLIPALQDLGAIVIYVDLWSQPQANPADLVHGAIRKSLNALQTPSTGMLQELILKLKLVSSFQTGAAGFKFGFKLADRNHTAPGIALHDYVASALAYLLKPEQLESALNLGA